jgi:hypothetical protein
LFRFFRTFGQAREAFTLLPEQLVLPLKRVQLALQLETLAVPNFFEQPDDSVWLWVVHSAR